MGFKKNKHSQKIKLLFFFPLQETKEVFQDDKEIIIEGPYLCYQDLVTPYNNFLDSNSIVFQTYMYYMTEDNEKAPIDVNFKIEVSQLQTQYDGTLFILIQSYISVVRNEIMEYLSELRQDIKKIDERLNNLPPREQIQMYKRTSTVPIMNKTISTFSKINPGDLDIAILFSQPIYDQKKGTPAKQPVDFRSQIQRLKEALKSAPRQSIKIKCQRATFQNLKFILRSIKPKILHIISHGTKDGCLQFEDDSSRSIGCLRKVTINEIKSQFSDLKGSLPQIVFVNTCYSQLIGKTFHQLGVKYVIMIDSADSIQDDAAQIFSQHFYRNIFKGQLVNKAYVDAKSEVQLKHNSHGCCCNHSSQEKHKQNCLWEKVKNELGKQNAHKLYHIPSKQCTCQLRNYNRHSLNCKWAMNALISINQDFHKIDPETGKPRKPKAPEVKDFFFADKKQLMVCCCIYPGKIPHSESHKFKFLTRQESPQILFEIIPGTYYPQWYDQTSHELQEKNEIYPKDFFGRQEELFKFLKLIKDTQSIFILLYGISGIGRSSFATKAASYLIQRRVFQLFFYIDLYDVKDKNMLYFTFNEKTKYKFDGKLILPSVRDKKIIFVLDNVDELFLSDKLGFYQSMNALKSQLARSKIIVIMKKTTCSSYEQVKLHSEKYELPPLNRHAAAQMLFFRIRHQLDLTIEYGNIFKLFERQETKSPKVIESVCHAFAHQKGLIKLNLIEQKMSKIGEGQNSVQNLIQQNLQNLKKISKNSYQMLIFISQFSQGLTEEDLIMFSLADNQKSLLGIPIRKNWKQSFLKLFKSREQEMANNNSESNIMKQPTLESADSNPTPSLHKNSVSIANQIKQIDQQPELDKGIQTKQSYFIQFIGPKRFIVKRFIRDYLWKGYTSEQNYYMKFLYVAFIGILLENIFGSLLKNKFVHEGYHTYHSLSQSGIYSVQTSISSLYHQRQLSVSARFYKGFQVEIEKIIDHNLLQQRLRKKDPTFFIQMHKQDFLNIYDHNWEGVYKYLTQNKEEYVKKFFIACLQNVLLYIPTALRITKSDNSLQTYAMEKSIRIVKQFQQRSVFSRNAGIFLKLHLMQIQSILEQPKPSKVQIDKIFNDLAQSFGVMQSNAESVQDYEELANYLIPQKQYIYLYMELQSTSDPKQILEIIKNARNVDKWKYCEQSLASKRNLLLGMLFLKVLKSSNNNSYSSFQLNIAKAKKQYQLIQEGLTAAEKIFNKKHQVKLELKSILIQLQLLWQFEQLRTKIKSFTQVKVKIDSCRQLVKKCEKIFNDRHNKLGGYTEFDFEIKKMARQIDNKLWEDSKNTIIFMRANPIWRYDNQTIQYEPIVQNLVRKKNNFRQQLQKVFREKVTRRKNAPDEMQIGNNPSLRNMFSKRDRKKSSQYQEYQLDISAKYEIFTQQKLEEQLQNGCSIMMISTNVRQANESRRYHELIFEGSTINEQSVPINEQFIKKFDFSKVRILIIAGENAQLMTRKIHSLIKEENQESRNFNKKMPVLIAISQRKNQKLRFDEEQDVFINYFLRREKNRASVLQFTKTFMKNIKMYRITEKEEMYKIYVQASSALVKSDLYLELLIDDVKELDINFEEGQYKDLSPGYQGNHNLKIRQNQNKYIFRRWQQLNKVFEYLHECNKTGKTAFINIHGQKSSGKTQFLSEMAKILVERQFYDYGVYILNGKAIAEPPYDHNIQKYISKHSINGQLPSLDYFTRHKEKKLILIIDDFHLIRPKSNGIYVNFVNKIKDSKINLIISTNEAKATDPLWQGQINDIYLPKMTKQQEEMLVYAKADYTCPNPTDSVRLTRNNFRQQRNHARHYQNPPKRAQINLFDLKKLQSTTE